MKQAYLIINQNENKLVNADDVDHADYSRIFQCPQCSETLTLRAGHYKGEVWISPTFVHPEGDPGDCKLRVTLSFQSRSYSDVLDILKKGQNRKSLEKAFMDFLRTSLEVNRMSAHPIAFHIVYAEHNGLYVGTKDELKKYIQYNKQPGRVHGHPESFLNACVALLGSQYNQKYFLDAVSAFQVQLLDEQESQDDQNAFEKRSSGRDSSTESQIKQHCRLLNGVLKFLCLGSSNDLRENFLDIAIFADYKDLFFDSQHIRKENKLGLFSGINLPQDVKREFINRREERIVFMRRFDKQLLVEICSNSVFVRESFQDFYNGSYSLSTELIEFVLSKAFLSIRKYDWASLPHYYNR